MIINRIWSMPNKITFKIKPIKELLDNIVRPGYVVVDPFANSSKYGTITNDLNPEFNTTSNTDALLFLEGIDSGIADVVLYDPPYSFRQATECYKEFGREKLKNSVSNMRYWSNCKDNLYRILKPYGVSVCFGWNSQGLGKNRGMETYKILLVPHGGSRNDTIVTIENKLLKD